MRNRTVADVMRPDPALTVAGAAAALSAGIALADSPHFPLNPRVGEPSGTGRNVRTISAAAPMVNQRNPGSQSGNRTEVPFTLSNCRYGVLKRSSRLPAVSTADVLPSSQLPSA